MVVFPNAKINIGLNIISRRQDGYHNIETVMYPIDWCDILEVVPAGGDKTTLTTTGNPVNCPPEKNLVMKAYNLLNETTPLPPVDIYLHKIIPDGAGLGGGSSDAAHLLIALNSMLSLNLSDDTLASITARIGADCPFFIYNRPTLATDTGTTLSPIDLSLDNHSIAVVKPDVSVPTAQAYAGVTPQTPATPLIHSINLPIDSWQQSIKNDFEKSIFPIHPIISEIKQTLLSLGAVYASMSGSGSAVYGIFKGDILADTIKCHFPHCATFSTRL